MVIGTSVDVASSPLTFDGGGSFRKLRAVTTDVVTQVDARPKGTVWKAPTSVDMVKFREFFIALMSGQSAPATADWCATRVKAKAAGYNVRRLYDTASGRYFFYAYELSTAVPRGQPYIYFNPVWRRNVVVANPHNFEDSNSDKAGINAFMKLSARAYIVNKASRCAATTYSGCDGTTKICGIIGEPYRESDVAHHESNYFHQTLTLMEDAWARHSSSTTP